MKKDCNGKYMLGRVYLDEKEIIFNAVISKYGI